MVPAGGRLDRKGVGPACVLQAFLPLRAASCSIPVVHYLIDRVFPPVKHFGKQSQFWIGDVLMVSFDRPSSRLQFRQKRSAKC